MEEVSSSSSSLQSPLVFAELAELNPELPAKIRSHCYETMMVRKIVSIGDW